MELNWDGRSGALQPTRMFDITGKHAYHVFDDDELLNDYNVKKLNRLVHGPNIDASDWGVSVANIREGTKTTVSHHCSMDTDHARTTACYFDDLHQNYCPCWEYKDDVGWVRCGLVYTVKSQVCLKHQGDEARKIFDKIRKGYPVHGRELNNPHVEPAQLVEAEPSKDELVKETDEEIEKQLENGGELDENAFVHSKLKIQAQEKHRKDVYRRKDTKEVERAQKEAVSAQDPTITKDVEQARGKYKVRYGQEMAERGKNQISIPELDERARNTGKSKGGRRICNGQNKGLKQQQSVGTDKENDLP